MCCDPECCEQEHREECSGCNGARRVGLDWDPWLAGLPPYLQTACALGAARLVLPRWVKAQFAQQWAWRPGVSPPGEAIGACAAWLRDPTAERLAAWHAAHRISWPGGEGIDMFVLSPVGAENGWVAARIQTCARLHKDTPAVQDAAKAQAVELLLHGEEME